MDAATLFILYKLPTGEFREYRRSEYRSMQACEAALKDYPPLPSQWGPAGVKQELYCARHWKISPTSE